MKEIIFGNDYRTRMRVELLYKGEIITDESTL